jgi:hypothetical protein
MASRRMGLIVSQLSADGLRSGKNGVSQGWAPDVSRRTGLAGQRLSEWDRYHR